MLLCLPYILLWEFLKFKHITPCFLFFKRDEFLRLMKQDINMFVFRMLIVSLRFCCWYLSGNTSQNNTSKCSSFEKILLKAVDCLDKLFCFTYDLAINATTLSSAF